VSLKLISYDLRKPGRDYSSLYAAIESIGSTRWHCLESVWLVRTPLSSGQVRDRIQLHLDANDKLLVASLGSDWATVGFDTRCNQWLRDNA
jgi:hypothetical protein